MLDPMAVINSAIPSVDPLDLERFWAFQSQELADAGASFSKEAILQVCKSPTADAVAVWARTTFIHILLMQGLLDQWHNGGKIHKAVFAGVAVYPLPNGLQEIDLAEFVATLSV